MSIYLFYLLALNKKPILNILRKVKRTQKDLETEAIKKDLETEANQKSPEIEAIRKT
jgi:hypothetical protein